MGQSICFGQTDMLILKYGNEKNKKQKNIGVNIGGQFIWM